MHPVGVAQQGGCAGYSYTGAAFFSLLMGRADAALSNVTELLEVRATKTGNKGMGGVVGPNTMYGERCKKMWPEPCPCMETPLHAADSMQVLRAAFRWLLPGFVFGSLN